MTPAAPAKRLWPRTAVGPLGNRATFHCIGDVPAGWTLETPPPAAAPTGPPTAAFEPPPVERNKGGRPRKVDP